MIRLLALTAALLMAVPAWASCELSSVRIGQTLIKAGDSERRVVEAGPDRQVQLETPEGGAAGIRFEFYTRSNTIQVYVRGGRVARICRRRN